MAPAAGHQQSGKVAQHSSDMPRLHMAAFQGDLVTLSRCIHDGEDVDATITLLNQSAHTVYGITPLYLAAQAGHKQACVLLVQAGADVLRTCSVPQSGDIFGPADIALVHFNLKTWMYLAGLKRTRLGKLSARACQAGSSTMAQPLMEHQAELSI